MINKYIQKDARVFFLELRVPVFLRYLQITKWRQNGVKVKLNAWQTDRRYFDDKSIPATYTLALSKKVPSVTRNSRNSKDDSALICSFPASHPPIIFLSFSAPFYGYFKPINSQQEEKKSKQVFEVTPVPWVPEVFLSWVGELRFVRQVFDRRPKAEDTSGEAARKNLWRRAPSFTVL